jgi:hypothetical protein
MTRAGEHLYLGDDRGLLDPSQGWAIEVENCAVHGKALPVSAWAISLAPPSIRDVTREFANAVLAAAMPVAGFPSSYVIREGRAA